MFIAYGKQSLLIGAPFDFSQKIRKFLFCNQDDSPLGR